MPFQVELATFDELRNGVLWCCVNVVYCDAARYVMEAYVFCCSLNAVYTGVSVCKVAERAYLTAAEDKVKQGMHPFATVPWRSKYCSKRLLPCEAGWGPQGESGHWASQDEKALEQFQIIVGDLGLPLAPDKMMDPSTPLPFLATEIDSMGMESRLPGVKKEAMLRLLNNMLGRQKVTVRDI
ncbi:hypothetical protein NDU88_005762 [Pleurodeles waltl]|uniref:Uncharacterized protein n=1 Tax=Pleurodeles waltl TaxID=8319 RepID=A0AAV7NRA8_PLEWA|nr:hypothetical protein NDU88_005762 [Pleurodeles waltl]